MNEHRQQTPRKGLLPGKVIGIIAAMAVATWGLSAFIGPSSEVAQAATPAANPAGFKTIDTFVKTHCIECHGGKSKKADLDLRIYSDEHSILKGRKIWEAAVEQVHGGDMPPDKRPKPTDAETSAFLHAVSAIFDRADRSAAMDPGRVTVRRLNKVEYNNTIRDLVGVDFEAAADFPSDEVGHGFDNIGDVLSISPVLMERYLAAAESVMQRAIAVELPKPVSRHQSARYTEPAGADVPKTRFRPVPSGSIFTKFRMHEEGEFTLRTRVFAAPPGDAKPAAAKPGEAKPADPKAPAAAKAAPAKPNGAPLKAAWLVDGKEVLAFDVVAANEKSATLVTHTLTIPAGEHKFEVALKSPGDAKQVLNVEFIEVAGPTDPRPASHRRLLTVDPKLPKREQTRQALTRFTTRAYRRPVAAPEVDRLVKIVESVEARGDKWEAGMQLAMQAALCSPKFLFRLELDSRPDSVEPHAIDEYQLASRLSYFLWSTMPDAELFDLAASKKLTANLDAQVRRMLKDAKAESLVENFAMQWLQLRRLRTLSPDSKTYPSFNDRLRHSMLRETELFVGAVVKEDRSILDLIDADFTFLNPQLAQHYGIADTNGNRTGQKPTKPGGVPFARYRPGRGEQFDRVTLQDKSRGGILTQASVLTVTSNPTRTSPVKRGKWVLEQILGAPPPPAPPNVPELEEAKEGHPLTGTLRQRMEQHRANPACANCHAKMDPLGFAFEQFDGVGGWRTQDGGAPIDPSGTLPDGKSFAGPAQLKGILKEKKDLFARCLAEKLMIYALGRGVEYYDKRSVDRIVEAMKKDDYKFSTLAAEIAKSDPFRMRRGKGQTD